MRKIAIVSGYALVIIVLVGLIFQTWRISGLKDRIEEDQAVMDSLNNRVAIADSFAAAIDSVAERRLAEIAVEVDQLEGQLHFANEATDDAEEKLDEVVAGLEPQIQERVKSAVETLRVAHNEETRALAELLAVERETASVLRGQLGAQRDLNRELQVALSEANVQITFYQNEVTSPFSFNIKADFVKVSLAFAGGFILAEVLD